VSAYDDEIWRLVPEPGGPPPHHLVEFVRGLPETDRALDLGCGDGRLSCELRAEELVLADVSEAALERARRRLPAAEAVRIEPDAPLPLPDSSFDLVLCAETLEHVRDVQLLVSEARRVLRPGGRVAVTTPAHGRATGLAVLLRGFEGSFDPLAPHIRFLTRRSLRGLLEEMGFDVRALSRRRGALLCQATR
jgi:ubiquinone/menaquinone biosynthesis C-methylase UbiE